uniref:Cadherin domain-containing protein n=1 Tax=Timema cristinae TaxID=61476 RepID=A0A7R9CLU8_TIMCR|nr:unnamed protein product [Timema cristinae]
MQPRQWVSEKSAPGRDSNFDLLVTSNLVYLETGLDLVASIRLTPVGTTIFQGVQAEDPDAGVNGQVDYHVVPGDGVGLGLDGGVGRDRLNVADGAGFFSINLPHQGQVTVNRSLDYEKTQRYLVTIVASVSTVFPSGSDEII